MTDETQAGALADAMIAAEIAVQDRMWGQANERADSTNNQLLDAAVAQLVLVKTLTDGGSQELAVANGREFYPEGWDGFRSYGGAVSNLVVAAAYIRSEIKRRVAQEEDCTRVTRGTPYTSATPYMSAVDAIKQLVAECKLDGSDPRVIASLGEIAKLTN